MTHDVKPVSSLKARSAELIRKARETGQPVILTQKGKATAVLQDIASYQRQREALLLLKLLAQGEQDYRGGRLLTHAQAKKHFRARLQELRTRE